MNWLRTWAPILIRRAVWNREFVRGDWSRTDSRDDFLYPVLSAHLRGGSLLELGCSIGNTSNEVPGGLTEYVGVDLSDAAIRTARTRGLARSTFVVDDLQTFEPTGRFDVILFRESLYYVPSPRVPDVLTRYAEHLTDRGVIIVRLWNRDEHARLMEQTQHFLEPVETVLHPTSRAVVVVVRRTRIEL